MGVDIIARGMAANAGGGGTVDAYTKAETDALLNQKQAKLVSGENLKTVNSNSLLGEGDVTIEEPLDEYKHIVHIQLVGEEMGEYENNNLYFTVRNFDGTEITTFEQLLSNFEPYETIVVYNAELNSTNMCITRTTETTATYSGADSLPIDVDDSHVVVIEDNYKKIN